MNIRHVVNVIQKSNVNKIFIILIYIRAILLFKFIYRHSYSIDFQPFSFVFLLKVPWIST